MIRGQRRRVTPVNGEAEICRHFPRQIGERHLHMSLDGLALPQPMEAVEQPRTRTSCPRDGS